jgi:hypothetical protein
MDYRLLIHSSLPDLLISRTHTFSTDPGFTHLYLLHSFQGLKRLTLFIIETYTLAYQLFLISYIFYRLCGFTDSLIPRTKMFNFAHYRNIQSVDIYMYKYLSLSLKYSI